MSVHQENRVGGGYPFPDMRRKCEDAEEMRILLRILAFIAIAVLLAVAYYRGWFPVIGGWIQKIWTTANADIAD